MPVCEPIRWRNIPPTSITTRYHHRERMNLHHRCLERYHGKTQNREKIEHCVSSANRGTDRENQCNSGTIPVSIRQLSAGRLERIPTNGRIRVQQWVSRKHQTHTIFRKVRNQPQISDDWTPDERRNQTTGGDELLAQSVTIRNDPNRTMAKRLLRCAKKARSESMIRRYGLVVAKKYRNHKTMQEVGLQENWTVHNLGKDRI